MHFPRFHLKVFCGLLLVLCAAMSAKADPVVITFDDLPPGAGASYPELGIGFQTVFTNASGHVVSNGSAFVQSSGQANTPPNAAFGDQLNPLALLHNNVAGEFYLRISGNNPFSIGRATTDFVSFYVVGTLPGQTDYWTVAFYDLSFNPYDLTTGLIGTVTGTTDSFVSFSSDHNIHAFVLITSGPNRREGIDTVSFNAPQVPEPATLLLLSTGLTGVAAKAYRRRKGRKQD